MSIHAVEKVFWEFGIDPARVGRYKADPDAYLNEYNLTEEERRNIKDINLKALADNGVSSILTLMVWPLIKGPEGMPMSYLKHMSGEQKTPPST